MILLFPSSYHNLSIPDKAFQKEYRAAQEAQLNIVLFDQKKWNSNREIILSDMCSGVALYRGWMMKPEEYTKFFMELQKQQIHLLNSPEEYKTMHLFPNIYPNLKGYTPKIITFQKTISVSYLLQELGPFMVKDYVKSAKNTDFPTYFTEKITQQEFDDWIRRFIEIRGKLFTGGLLAKKYITLKKYGNKTNEYRVFYLNKEPISISRNSLQPDYTPTVPTFLVEQFHNLPSSFYTVDFAEKEDGSWFIIEVGDGGVSGLSEGQNYNAFFRAIKSILSYEQEKNIEYLL